ncbi:saccharopine dehydrogenase family protein [Bacillota bacterium]
MGKKIFVLGGAGNIGSELTRGLLAFEDISEVMIGEYNLKSAEKLAKELNDSRVRTVFVDVKDTKDTVSKIHGYDLFMNATHFDLFDYALSAACNAGINYIDLISEPTEEQAELVRNAGITAMSGVGISPGLTNILARYSADQLDSTDEIHIHWTTLRTIAPSKGLLGTVFWESANECPTRMYYLNGHFEVVPPLEGSKKVKFAEPMGEQICYYLPHPETVSLPKNIPGVKYVSVRGTWRPQIMEDMSVLNRYGLLDPVEIDVDGKKIRVSDIVEKRIWQVHGGKLDENLWASFINVEVIGYKGGNRKKIITNVSHPTEWRVKGTSKATGIPAAVCTALLARNGSNQAGIIYPEEYYNGTEVLKEFRDKFPMITIETTITEI